MDTQSEPLVQNALDKASATRTTIIVAHRLSTIKNFDHIVVLDHGEIAEQGTHKELINLNSTYADLVQKQAIETKKRGISASETAIDNEGVLRQEQSETHQQVQAQQQQDITKVTTADYSTQILMGDDESKYKVQENEVMDAYELKLREERIAKKLIKKQKTPI